jgi:NADH dehydrogenase FAD-containing subunit
MRANEVPWLSEHAISTWDADDMLRLRDSFGGVAERAGAGERQRVVFLVPPNNKCSGPLYEIVLMLETWLRRRDARSAVEIVWTTCEHSYIQAFGPRLHDVVSEEFARRGIEGHTEYVVREVEERKVHYESGESLGYDLLVAFPPYVAGMQFPGLPADDRGFLSTDLATRRVQGHPETFAVGDAGDFPVKQAFLAFVQGDAAAGEIAAELDPSAKRAPFDPVSMCVMEQFDKATFAKVPLRLTGDRRLGKKMLGLSVPWRFRHARPFHSGPFWSAMDAGLGVMSKLFARSGS